jgi:hypothetical protein
MTRGADEEGKGMGEDEESVKIDRIDWIDWLHQLPYCIPYIRVYPISTPAAHVNLGAGMRCRQSRCMPMITLCADDHLIPTERTRERVREMTRRGRGEGEGEGEGRDEDEKGGRKEMTMTDTQEKRAGR